MHRIWLVYIAGITVDEAASKAHKKAGISEQEMAHLRKEMKKQFSFVEISDFTNKYRKKIKNAIKDNETTSADAVKIITGVIPGSKGKETYGKTVKIVKTYRSKRAV